VEVRIRLGTGIARLAPAPLLVMQLTNGATVGDVCNGLAESNPELASALHSAVAIVGGKHVDRDEPLAHGEELALLAPISGGSPRPSISREASHGHRTG
jgi:molybdopterin converting factor small subunit